jgi:hypothetical protein
MEAAVNTRLKDAWPELKEILVKKWKRLPRGRLDCVNGDFSRLLSLIGEVYYPGRSLTIVEGEVRGFLNKAVGEILEGGDYGDKKWLGF